jgi:hypothetical protein
MSLISVAELMTDPDFARTVTLRRPTRAFVAASEGETAVTYADTTITAIVQPVVRKGDEPLPVLPEGARGSGRLATIYCGEQLRADEGAGWAADIILVADADATRSYKVVNTEDWSDNGYWRAIGEEIAT